MHLSDDQEPVTGFAALMDLYRGIAAGMADSKHIWTTTVLDDGRIEWGWVSVARGVDAIHARPAKRARRTAEIIASCCGSLTVEVDDRLRERMNWTTEQPLPDFLADWARTTADRDYHPAFGESSRQAGQRLLSYLDELRSIPVTIAAATHGGVTVDLLRTLLGGSAVPPALLQHGVPPGAVTTLDGTRVVTIADITHLSP